MLKRTLNIATRKSPLALWQAEYVKAQLQIHHPDVQVELVTFVTKGDKILDVPLAKIGGKGLFVKELETALLTGDADIAVHSTKDLPMQLPDGLDVPIFMSREDPSDALVSQKFASLSDLPKGAIVGTSSLRRQTQLLAARPDLRIESLRGNVGTRLSKLDTGDYDAIILASSGLKRLGLESRIAYRLPEDISLPAVGQGALAIEMRMQDSEIYELIAPLNCTNTQVCIQAERAMNKRLKGGCQVPIAGFAKIVISGDTEAVWLRGRVLNTDGSVMLQAEATGLAEDAQRLGIAVADSLLAQGAADILAAFYT